MKVDVDALTESLEEHTLTYGGTEYTGEILSFPQMAPFISTFSKIEEEGEDSAVEALADMEEVAREFLTKLNFTSDDGDELDVDSLVDDLPAGVLLHVVMDFFEAQMDQFESLEERASE